MKSNQICHHQSVKHWKKCDLNLTKSILISFLVTLLVAFVAQHSPVEALWFFQNPLNQTQSQEAQINQLQIEQEPLLQQQLQQQPVQETLGSTLAQATLQQTGGSMQTFGSNLLAIAGIQPSRIASILNTVGETGFSYFNIEDQCRNRAACDLGAMLYKRLSFVHNWLIRTSVRTLTDMNNIYTQSWMEGMLGRNCTSVYVTCRQSPLEGLMNVAFLQHFAS